MSKAPENRKMNLNPLGEKRQIDSMYDIPPTPYNLHNLRGMSVSIWIQLFTSREELMK